MLVNAIMCAERELCKYAKIAIVLQGLTYEAADHIQHIDQCQGEGASSNAPLQLWPSNSVTYRSNDCHLQECHCEGIIEAIKGEERLQGKKR